MTLPSSDHFVRDLVTGLRNRDSSSLGLLYDHYSSALFGVINRIVSDPSVAQEVLQDSFVRIWDRIENFDESKGRLFTWMLNISRNLAIDKMRSKELKKAEKTDDLTNYVSIINDQFKVDLAVDGIGIKELIGKLKKEEQEVLDLVYFKGYTHSEITREYGIPLGTVKTRIRSALIQLRKSVKEH